MCGRYTLFTDQDYEELSKMIQEIEAKTGNPMKMGDIYPTNIAPVLSGEALTPKPYIWGFPNFAGKSGVIINARAETALEKKMFREAALTRRCVIPSTGFYEWKQNDTKQKYLFTLPGEKILYMAGLYTIYDGKERFVILTTSPNASVADVHNRMPVVLPHAVLPKWVNDTDAAVKLLAETPPLLQKRAV